MLFLTLLRLMNNWRLHKKRGSIRNGQSPSERVKHQSYWLWTLLSLRKWNELLFEKSLFQRNHPPKNLIRSLSLIRMPGWIKSMQTFLVRLTTVRDRLTVFFDRVMLKMRRLYTFTLQPSFLKNFLHKD